MVEGRCLGHTDPRSRGPGRSASPARAPAQANDGDCMTKAGADGGVSCLIPAAGAGLRLGQGTKGYLSLAGRPLLCWLADKALQVADEVIVAVPADRLEDATRL